MDAQIQARDVVKRFPNGPPYLSPPQMASDGTVKGAYREGQLTGGYLRAHGVNWDLAPVSDVPTRPNAFIWKQGRSFGMTPVGCRVPTGVLFASHRAASSSRRKASALRRRHLLNAALMTSREY